MKVASQPRTNKCRACFGPLWAHYANTEGKEGELSSEGRDRPNTESFTFLDDLVEDAVGGLAVAGRNANPRAIVQGSRPGAELGVVWHLEEAAGAPRTLASRLAAGSTRVQTAPHLKSTTPH
jgi:hypothetical protein